MVDWPTLREDPNEWVDEVHGMDYLIAVNHLSISVSPDLRLGIASQLASW